METKTVKLKDDLYSPVRMAYILRQFVFELTEERGPLPMCYGYLDGGLAMIAWFGCYKLRQIKSEAFKESSALNPDDIIINNMAAYVSMAYHELDRSYPLRDWLRKNEKKYGDKLDLITCEALTPEELVRHMTMPLQYLN